MSWDCSGCITVGSSGGKLPGVVLVKSNGECTGPESTGLLISLEFV